MTLEKITSAGYCDTYVIGVPAKLPGDQIQDWLDQQPYDYTYYPSWGSRAGLLYFYDQQLATLFALRWT